MVDGSLTVAKAGINMVASASLTAIVVDNGIFLVLWRQLCSYSWIYGGSWLLMVLHVRNWLTGRYCLF